ncbi:hypothetical protein CCH79_00017511, partial [Gambusia affinis]
MSEGVIEDGETGAESTEWTQENLQKLFASLKDTLPENKKTQSYIRGLKAVDWDKVAFPPFSAGECREKWNSIMGTICKYRTLLDILDEAEDLLSNPFSDKNIHPDMPKPPCPPRSAYIRKNMSRYARKNPEKNVLLVKNTFYKKYDELSDKKKAKYAKKYSIAFEEYSRKIKIFWNGYILFLIEHSKAGKAGETSHGTRFIPMKKEYEAKLMKYLNVTTTWTTADLLKLVGRIRRNTPESEKRSSYQVGLLSVNWDKTAFRPYSAKECHDMWQKVMKKTTIYIVLENLERQNSLDSLSLLIEENAAEKPSLGSAFFSEMKKRWRKLDAAEKDEYYTRCLKMKHEYNAKLKEYLDRFDETEKQRFIKEQDIRFLKVKPLRTSPCEPKMPSQSIFTYLARDKRMSSAKSKNLLHKLPVKEKERYKEQMRSDMERYSENLRKWFKKLTPEEQTKYLIQKPNVSTLKFTNVFKVGFLKLVFQLALQKLQFLDAKKKQVCDREELNLSQPS